MKKTIGLYFNLETMFIELNTRFFDDKIKAELRWGRSAPPGRGLGAKKRSLRLGSYHPDRQLITIHPCLDQAIVPAICVERILFHEMIHQYVPAKRSISGRNLVHSREFNLFERKYPYLKEADSWIKANLERLLKF